jgi:fructose PTS system EIIBC or EIIC component
MNIFAVELIDLDLQVTDKVAAIRSLAERAVAAGRGSDAALIAADVLERDEKGTPQFDGIAIPHARTTGVSVPSVLIARSSTEIVFDPEEPAADVVLMILVPVETADQHLEILSGLARRLMNPEFTSALRNASASELIAVLETEGNKK